MLLLQVINCEEGRGLEGLWESITTAGLGVENQTHGLLRRRGRIIIASSLAAD